MFSIQPGQTPCPSQREPDDFALLELLAEIRGRRNDHGWTPLELTSMSEVDLVRQLSDRGWVEIVDSEVRLDLVGNVKAGTLICAVTELGSAQLGRISE